MIALATTLIDVYRDATPGSDEETDVTRNEWGDEVDTPRPDTDADDDTDPDPLTRGIPASIIERTRRVPDENGGNLVPVTFIVGRVSGDVDVRPGDRLYDRNHGAWYAVEDATQPQSPVMLLDRRLELVKVG